MESQDDSTGYCRKEDHSLLLCFKGECLEIPISKYSSGQVDQVYIEDLLGFEDVRKIRWPRVVYHKEDKEQRQEGKQQALRHLSGVKSDPDFATCAQDVPQIGVQVTYKRFKSNLVVNGLHSVGEEYEFSL